MKALRVVMVVLASAHLGWSTLTALVAGFADGGSIPERLLAGVVHPVAALLLVYAVVSSEEPGLWPWRITMTMLPVSIGGDIVVAVLISQGVLRGGLVATADVRGGPGDRPRLPHLAEIRPAWRSNLDRGGGRCLFVIASGRPRNPPAQTAWNISSTDRPPTSKKAMIRHGQDSPPSNFHGKAPMMQRWLSTFSMSPPTFSAWMQPLGKAR